MTEKKMEKTLDMKLRKAVAADKETYIALAREFYASDAVLHTIPDGNYAATFCEAVGGSPYVDCYMVSFGNVTAGYVLTAKTYSQEAGGVVWWIEEIYIRPEFQGKGIGGAVLRRLKEDAEKSGAARLRLEYEPSNVRAVRLYEKYGFVRLCYNQMVIEMEK